MPKSPFFARIKTHVLQIASAVPHGRLVTFSDVGAWLDVPPRHVAYVLSTLKPDEEAQTPWYRIVGTAGVVPLARTNAFDVRQKQLLTDEGVEIAASGQICNFAQTLIGVGSLDMDLPKQTRPPDAPVHRA